MKLTIDSPTSKLLYNKEVQGYKAMVKRYYQEVRQLPRIPEDAMQYYLKQLSGVSLCSADLSTLHVSVYIHQASLQSMWLWAVFTKVIFPSSI